MPPLAGQDNTVTGADLTLANWMQAPYNRLAFQRVGDLVPSVRVAGAGPAASRWPASAARDVPPLDASVRDVLDATYTDAFVVLQNGQVRHEEYRHGMTARSRHLCMSVSKSVAGTVAGVLVGDGLLDPAAPVTDLVPEFASTGMQGATVRHVLDMRTGTREEITTEQLQRAYYATALWAPPPDHEAHTLDADTRAHFWRFVRAREHGDRFEYRSTLTCVLAMLMERATGRSYPELLSEHLWQPMGAESDAEITVDAGGYALADIGLSCTARDLARLGEVLRRNGLTADGRRVLPGPWVADTLTPDPGQQAAFAARGSTYLPWVTGYYRNQWWVAAPRRTTHDGAYFALGIHGQLLYVDEAAELVVVKFSSWPEAWAIDLAEATYELCRQLGDRLG
jgi:CubicO group peptidase (beta-lactamase class C family)